MSEYCAKCGYPRLNHRIYPVGLRCPYQRKRRTSSYKHFEEKPE